MYLCLQYLTINKLNADKTEISGYTSETHAL